MTDHIERMTRAIELKGPDCIPMEIIDVPGIYNAYHTQDRDTVELIPGTEDFDAIWANCYSWRHEVVGQSDAGEPIKTDQFGTRFKTPHEEHSAYMLLSHPLAEAGAAANYEFPDPADMDPLLDSLGNAISTRYPDRFVEGYIDAGIFLTTQLLIGLEEFLYKVAAEPDFVVDLYSRVEQYYRQLIPKFKRAGVHMITVIEDIGGTGSLVMRPDTWRERFKPILQRFIGAVHAEGMYAGLAIDGHSGDVLDDVVEMGVDVFSVFDMHTTGLDLIAEKLGGKVCVKATIDMQHTLATGTPEQVEAEAARMVQALHRPEGGFIAQVVRWHRPTFPNNNVLASVRGFNRFRQV